MREQTTPLYEERMDRALRICEAAAQAALKIWGVAMAALFTAGILVMLGGPVLAAPTGPAGPEALCRAATDAAERAHGTPSGLLRAVSLVESGRSINGAREAWPWTINLEGAGHWFDSRGEALAFARAALARGKTSFDIGCMQINYRWHSKEFGSLEEMFDPEHNADYAARYLTSLKAETGDWMGAAGFYHSRTPSRSKKYRGLIAVAFAEAQADKRARRKAIARPAPLERAFAAVTPAAPATKPRIDAPKTAQDAPSHDANPRTVGPRRDAKPARGSWPSMAAGTPLIDRDRRIVSQDGAWRGLVRLASASGKPSDAAAAERAETAPPRSTPRGGLALDGLARPAAGRGGLLRGAQPLL